MSVSGIFSNGVSSNQAGFAYRPTQWRLQQLGQDLTAGNLSAAQSDFAILKQMLAQTASASTASNAKPIAQPLQQLEADLKSGNLAAAKQGYLTIQQELPKPPSGSHLHSHHPFRIVSGSEQSVPGAANETQNQSPGVSFLA